MAKANRFHVKAGSGTAILVSVLLLLICAVQAGLAHNNPLPRGERILSIDLNEAQGVDYQTAFDLAASMGNQNVNLSFDWRDLEAMPGHIASDIVPIINQFYPLYEMPVSLFIRPISTGLKVVPADLMETAFDDPLMITRFEALVDYVFAQTPDMHISHFIIGSEIDAYLGTDAKLWTQYTTLVRHIRDYIKASHPHVLVATEGLFTGMTGAAAAFFEAIHPYVDVIGVSYYPLNSDFTVRPPEVIHDDFALLTQMYPDKPIAIFQLGYPSSALLNSSEALQAQFIRAVFSAWDEQADRIVFIKFTWMHELSPQVLAYYVKDYYAYADEKFAAFLGSLGMRTYEGRNKPAFDVLREEAVARGWGSPA